MASQGRLGIDMHYYKRNLGDYAKKAGRLSMLQHGSYTLLIDACYDREEFPTIEQAIEWTWASTTEEIEAVTFVLRKFFMLENGVYVQKRIQEELAEYHNKAATNTRIAVDRETKRKENITNRERTVNEPPPNQEPRTTNQEPLTKNQEPLKSKAIVASDAGRPDCPHQEIIDLYHKILPELPAVQFKNWTPKRRAVLQARWREDVDRQNLEFWGRYFAWIRNFPFYLGENDRKWKPNLDWILKPEKFIQFLEKEIV